MENRVLIKYIKEGDKRGWNMLIDKYSRTVYNLAFNFCGCSDDANDLTQDIFIKIYKNIDKFDESFNISSWIIRISKNHCIDYWRKNKKNNFRIDLEDNLVRDENSPEDNLIKSADLNKLREKILQLKPEVRSLLILRDIQNHSYQEIADSLNIPLGTVKSKINRARIQLAKLYEDR
ncbi:MAG: RNA polymerase sigma factor [Candidatus Aminicenantes bacterium]|nr:RNA polymerase sigma factor [Candidatus Aminicenantes bacterium]